MTENQSGFLILVHLGKCKAVALAGEACLHCGTAKLPAWHVVTGEHTILCGLLCCLRSLAPGAASAACTHLCSRHNQAWLGERRRAHKRGAVGRACFNLLFKN